MNFELSEYGAKLSGRSGILDLMDDLGRALSGSEDLLMLGGGQPAHIPEVQQVWRDRMQRILGEGEAFDRMLGNYDPPNGNVLFVNALVECLNREYGWDLAPANIAITNGGQTAFFFLLNMLAGDFSGGRRKKILLPLMPEYIGYADQGLRPDLFTAAPPKMEFIDDHTFKYHIDFDRLTLGDDIGAMCVSRPTNPTGNVLTDTEIQRLADTAQEKNIPLIIDNAYGAPFPQVLFRDVKPIWNDSIILTLSLSKLGLPGTRTGIVIATEQIATAIASINSVVGLANGSIGQMITWPLLENGELLRISREVIRPFYERKSRQTREWIASAFDPSWPYYVHVSEGALFLWLWFKDLPIPSAELYERLKARKVLVIPGHHFFYGLDEDWPHRHECIRMTYSQPEEVVREGIRIIAEEVGGAYASC